MPDFQNMTCEQALMLMSRHLDGDLSKEETWQIHHHAAKCPDCQIQMEEMAAIELHLSDYNESYRSYSVSPQFNAKLMTAIAEFQHQKNSQSFWQPWQEKLKFLKPFIRSPFFPVSVGVTTSLLIFFLFDPFLSPQASRFTVAETPINQTQQDEGQWHQEHTIPPGQVAVISVKEDGQKSSSFQMSSSQPIKVLVRYNGNDQDIQVTSPQKMLHAILKAPKITDAVMIRNEGNSPLKVNAQSHRPKVIQFVSIQHNALQQK